MKLIMMTLTLLSSMAFADTVRVKGMDCSHCEQQVSEAVCKNAEISKWLATCDAKVVDAKHEIGESHYTLAPGQKMDSGKMSQIEKAVVATGRTVEKTPAKN